MTRVFSETHRQNISRALKGRAHSNAHRQNLSRARGGRVLWSVGMESKDHNRATRKAYARQRREKVRANQPRPEPEVCEACGRPPDVKTNGEPTKLRLRIDHDHVTGVFRGWLCHHCNVSLGHCHDDPVILRALADYLERSK